jgi:hypothetical protein
MGVVPQFFRTMQHIQIRQLALQFIQQLLLVDHRQSAVDTFVVENIHDGFVTLCCFYKKRLFTGLLHQATCIIKAFPARLSIFSLRPLVEYTIDSRLWITQVAQYVNRLRKIIKMRYLMGFSELNHSRRTIGRLRPCIPMRHLTSRSSLVV